MDAELLKQAVWAAEQSYQGFDDSRHVANRLMFIRADVLPGRQFDTLVFQGSNDALDWIINLTALPPVPYGRGWCHPGFAVAHRSIWKRVTPLIDPLKPLLVTGHSLGGALAEKSCDFLRYHVADLHMITFGKPNVHLKGRWPDMSYLATQLSVVHGSDIVTRLPRYLYGPDPSQTQLYFDSDGRHHFNPSRRFKRNDWRRVKAFNHHGMLGYSHRVGQYLEAM